MRQRQGTGRDLAGGVCAALLLVLTATPAPAEIASLWISQARQTQEGASTLRTYLDIIDTSGNRVRGLGRGQLSATLGEFPLSIDDVRPFDPATEGISYVFLIDISKSLSSNEFDLILDALDVWVLSLGPHDRVAVIAFGDESRVVVDFTRDVTRIQAGLFSLGPSDDRTLLHEALRDGLELCARRDPDLPGRRVLMVLTDGRDEGSGLAADDILALLRRDPMPIYAIGLSRIRDPAERRRYLDLLNRFAANSGGAFFEGSTETLGTAYEAIRQSIQQVWVVDISCPSCRVDGEVRRLQMSLNDRGRVLSAGRPVRLLPSSQPPRATAAPLEPVVAEDTSTLPEEPTATREPVTSSSGGGPPAWLWFLLVAAAAATAFWWLRRRVAAPVVRAGAASVATTGAATAGVAAPPPPRPPATQRVTPTPPPRTEVSVVPEEVGPAPETSTYTTETGIETTRPPRPAIMRMVRMIVVRGAKPGRQYTLTLFQNAVVGSRTTCDCVLVDPGVSPEQFELRQRDGRVYILNRAGENPTLVDGLPISETHPLKSNSLVGNRDFIVRLMYEDARPVNT